MTVFVILYMLKHYLFIVNDVGITLSAQELPLREAAWPAVGEELEAKSNGLWHRATVAEIGSACWTTETIQFHSFPTTHKSRSVSSFPTQAMRVYVCAQTWFVQRVWTAYGMQYASACQHITWT